MSRAWYLLCLVPLAIGVAIGVVGILGLVDEVEAMDRVVVPGEATLDLAPGDHVVFGETTSRKDGVLYRTASFSVRCGITGPDGAPVAIGSPTGSTSYAVGGYEGASIAEFTVVTAGAHRIACEGDGDPSVIAIGDGVGGNIAGALLAIFGGFAAALALFLVIWWRRRRAKRAQSAAATAAAFR